MPYVHLGTPYDTSTTFVPVWQQEAEGRFHGAFTGGFSAGYFNTVGSREGWTPKAFSSSRSQQRGKEAADTTTTSTRIDELMDEEDKIEFGYQASLQLKKPLSATTRALPSSLLPASGAAMLKQVRGHEDEDEDDIYDQNELHELRKLKEKERPFSSTLAAQGTLQSSATVHSSHAGLSLFSEFHLSPETLVSRSKFPFVQIPDGWTSSRKTPRANMTDNMSLVAEPSPETVSRFLLPEEVARKALQSYIPFSHELGKQKRYLSYLNHFSVSHRTLSNVNELLQVLRYPSMSPALPLAEAQQELYEFHSAASIYHKPLSKSLALRFTSESSSQTGPSSIVPLMTSSQDGSSAMARSNVDPVESLIRRGLLLKRSSQSWLPSSLLLKRFHVDAIGSNASSIGQLSHVQPVLNDQVMLQLKSELQSATESPSNHEPVQMEIESETIIDPIEKYSIAFLKSIFESCVEEQVLEQRPEPGLGSGPGHAQEASSSTGTWTFKKPTTPRPSSHQGSMKKIQRQTLSFEVEED